METNLPVFKWENFEFIIDVQNNNVWEKSDPKNIYLLWQMDDLGKDGYTFEHYEESTGRCVKVNLPPLMTLDPSGMALKYNKSLEEIKGASDFEVMVDQGLLKNRISSGQLPTITIGDSIFYADARIDLLRPKDDFSTMGIRFDDLDDYYVVETNTYAFPYNPRTHEIAKLDYENITEYPKDLLFVEIPDVKVLDPVGWNRRNGWPETDDLKWVGLTLEFDAKIIPWKQTGIDDLITENRLKKPIQKAVKAQENSFKNKRGPKL
ncbi:hypothetical protein [Chryseobacterium gambrini]|uniref:Uncharacterized protein n=1 Tax=Chryseobacterium gambrini TaxID=373672 RepID=A0A1N7PYN4_9FLAO|nr:hypothetical protein [Chryseobacterium gambrini]SIT15738.1 hypothetical protein SAMN05421785_10841 [Chryseobacterium gambrini]